MDGFSFPAVAGAVLVDLLTTLKVTLTLDKP